MSANRDVMAGAFQAGAGFSASEFSDFLVALIAVTTLIWGTILVIGWLRSAQRQHYPSEYLITRLMMLGIMLSLIFSVLGSSST